MAERKWMDSILLPRKQREDYNDEYDSIASKVAKEWLIENGYEVYDFIWDILWKASELRLRTKRIKRKKYASFEKGLELLQEREEFFTILFGDSLEDFWRYEQAIRKFSKDSKIGLVRHYPYFGIGPDFIVKKNNEVCFLDVIVNQAEPKELIKDSYRIAKEHGFKTMVLKLDVEIKIGEKKLVIEPLEEKSE